MKARIYLWLLSILLLTPVAVTQEAEQLSIQLSGTAETIRAVSLDTNCDRDSGTDSAELSRNKPHGLRLLNSQTDQVIWQLDSLTAALCADITAVDTNQDSYIDRLYFATTGGQLWRVDLRAQDRDLWQAQLLLELEAEQPFYNAPDVVVSQDGTYFAVIIGTGAKQLPEQQAVQNYLIFYRDHCVQSVIAGCDSEPKTLANLQQLTNPNRAQQPLNIEKYNNGWYLPLELGEATVTRAVTNNYTTLVATFSSATHSSCTGSQCKTAGESRLYHFNPFHFDSHSELDNKPYYRRLEGTEPLSEPVPFVLLPSAQACGERTCNPSGPIVSGFSFGQSKQQIEQPELGLIKKIWWYSRRDR